ncbi:MAG: HAMP domain-containing histidine kinase [Faecalibacterium sp.]|jgi:K+-sensing histidine kinase KdpD|nr:HAMP domain-containing histidine kinase [Faecalibacterium sp.]
MERAQMQEPQAALSETEKDYIRDVLLDAMATEFFQPLNLIALNRDYLRLYLQHEKAEYSEKKVGQALDGIEGATDQLDRLMNNSLDLMSCLRGRMQPQIETVDLKALIEDIVADSEKAAHLLGLTLQQNLPQEEIHVQTDHAMAERVLLNLLSNAMRAGEKGAVRFSLDKTPDGCTVQLTNEGQSVTPAFASRAFALGPRPLDAPRQASGRAGLGLYLCGTFCRLLGWQPTMHAVKGGTAVRLHIPARQIVSGQRLVFHAGLSAQEQREHTRLAVLQELRTLPGLEMLK